MAVQATEIISVEQITISVPIGTQLNIADIPNILYVNYNGAPFHGYITLTESDKRKILVLNPRTTTSSTSSSTISTKGIPVEIVVDPVTGNITNIPTDIQQEVLLKGGIKSNIKSDSGVAGKEIVSFRAIIFYISILVGGIDWKPSSRFPGEVDIMDSTSGYLKEPVTSSDIPAIDAYQYLISLQTRSQAEDYQLESLKQSLANKMILARDINFLMSCVEAIEKAYFDLLTRMERMELRLGYIEDTWLPNLESRLFTSQMNIKNLWDRLNDNFDVTHTGLLEARKDVYERVYRGLKHYGSLGLNQEKNRWFEVPIYGNESIISRNIDLADGNILSYDRILDKDDTSTSIPISISSVNSSTLNEDGISDDNYLNNVYGVKNITYNKNASAWFKNEDRWAENFSDLSHSGNEYVNVNEYFHNLVVKDSRGGVKGVIITQDQIGLYNNMTKDGDITNASKGAFKVTSVLGGVNLQLWNNRTAISTTDGRQTLRLGRTGDPTSIFTRDDGSSSSDYKPYTFIGTRDETESKFRHAGIVIQPLGDSPTTGKAEEIFITGQRVHFANSNTHGQYMNIYNGADEGQSYIIINVGNGGTNIDGDSGFFIGKTQNHVVMEYESFPKHFCGISYSNDGLHLYGLSKKTLNCLKEALDALEEIDTTEQKENELTVIKGSSSGGPISKTISDLRSIKDGLFNNPIEYGWRTSMAAEGKTLNRIANIGN